ncbi:MAG: hypothetical protein D6735_10975 [Acidobacteria bacterium]|nr:MAG: hypothetical protein D6735_10975 [Acidobacteriota bacterium]
MLGVEQNFGTITAVIGLLFSFGLLYNQVVEYLLRKRYAEGYTSLLVAFGVFVTLAGVAVIDLSASLLALIAFAASGTPMVIGSIVRYVRKREAMQRAIIEDIRIEEIRKEEK